MRLGLGLPHLGPATGPEVIRRAAAAAEDLGYHSLWTLDRAIKAVAPQTPYPGTPDGSLPAVYRVVYEHLTVLTYAAAITEHVRLGVSVLNLPFYQPLLLARRIATIDQLSGGRIDLGVGAGWSRDEFRAVGIPFAERGPRTEEAILALKALWGEDPVAFHGQFLDVPAGEFGPKPAQRPHPPLYVGGFTRPALTRAGRLGDGFTGCCAPVSALLDMRAQVRDAAAAAGRNPADIKTVIRCNVQLTDRPVNDVGRPAGTGSWEQIRADTLKLRDAGVDELFFDFNFADLAGGAEALLGQAKRFRGILD